MIPRRIIVICSVLALAVLSMTLSASRFYRADASLRAAGQLAQSTSDAATEIRELRSIRASVAERKPPEQDVIARIHASLTQAGLQPEKHFRSLRPESDAPLPAAPQYRRRSVNVNLAQLDLPGLGAFLANWQRDNPLWTPTRIEFVHVTDKARLEVYDSSITFSAVYLAPSSSTSSSS
jgi:hypothetical protein